MTNQDAKEILRREYLRVVDRLGEVDPVTNPKLYKELLCFVDNLYSLSGLSMDDTQKFYEKFPVGFTGEPSQTPEPYVEETPVTVMEPAPDPEPAEDTGKSYSKEEVRAALAKGRKAGVNVTELLGELGYDNFSAVPAGKYGELMARLGES